MLVIFYRVNTFRQNFDCLGGPYQYWTVVRHPLSWWWVFPCLMMIHYRTIHIIVLHMLMENIVLEIITYLQNVWGCSPYFIHNAKVISYLWLVTLNTTSGDSSNNHGPRIHWSFPEDHRFMVHMPVICFIYNLILLI